MTIFLVVLGAVCLLSWALTVWQLIREPRRTGFGLAFVWCLFITWIFAVIFATTLSSRDNVLDVIFLGPLFLVVLSLVAAAIFLFFNTGQVVRKEGFRLVTLVPAVVGTLLVAGLGGGAAFLIMAFSGMSANRVIFALAVILPLIVLPLLVVIVELAGYTLYALIYGRLGISQRSEVVVVLGAGLSGEKVTPLLASRIDRGIEVFGQLRDKGADPVLVLSGGKGDDEVISEAEAMGRYAREKGFPEDKIVLEVTSTTTEENLRNTIDVLDQRGISWHSLAVVTSNFHVLRTASLTRRLGTRAQVLGAHTAAYYVPAGFLREFVATFVHYRKWNIAVLVTAAVLTWGFVAFLWCLSIQQTDLVLE